MSNLIPLDQAARMLGISVDRLTEMRSNNEIFGYRDGATWKFKVQELERVAGELGIDLGSAEEADDDDDFQLSDSGSDSLQLLSESSDDLLLDDNESSGDLNDGDELSLVGDDDRKGAPKNVLDDDDDLLFGGSSLKLGGENKGKGTGGADKDSDVLADDNATGKPLDSSTGKLLAALQDDDELSLAPAEDDMELVDSSQDSGEFGSDFEDSEIVLDDSDSSSELVLDSGDDLDLGGDGSDRALAASLNAGGDIDDLELAADDDVLSLGDMAGPDSATMMQEDDFNLSPMEPSDADDNSSSQVIALDDSDLFEDSSADPLADSSEGALGGAPELLDANYEGGFGEGGFGEEAGVVGALTGGTTTVVARPEVPYTRWQVAMLGLTAAGLAVGCMLLWDVARNLWTPDDRVLESGLLKLFIDTFAQG